MIRSCKSVLQRSLRSSKKEDSAKLLRFDSGKIEGPKPRLLAQASVCWRAWFPGQITSPHSHSNKIWSLPALKACNRMVWNNRRLDIHSSRWTLSSKNSGIRDFPVISIIHLQFLGGFIASSLSNVNFLWPLVPLHCHTVRTHPPREHCRCPAGRGNWSSASGHRIWGERQRAKRRGGFRWTVCWFRKHQSF